MALSGAGSLRSFYTSGIIMHRPDEDRPERMLHFELRNGPGIEPIVIDKANGRWIEIDRSSERLVRKAMGDKLDAERVRKHDVILGVLLDEALEGRLYTINQFAEAFENRGGLGGKDTIRDRLNVLATKGFVKFLRDGTPYGLGPSRSRFGFLCVEGMTAPTGAEAIDPDTGEVVAATIAVLPTHYKSPQTGVLLINQRPQASNRQQNATKATLRCLGKKSASTSCRKPITYRRFQTPYFVSGHISAAQRRAAVGERVEATSCPRLHR